MAGKPSGNVFVIGPKMGGKSSLLGYLLSASKGLTDGDINAIPTNRKDAQGKLNAKAFPFVWDRLEDRLKRIRALKWGVAEEAEAIRSDTVNVNVGSIEFPTFDLVAFYPDAMPDKATLASHTDIALLVIPAPVTEFEPCTSSAGIVRQLMSYAHESLGATKCILAVTKMDNTEPPYSQERFDEVAKEMCYYLKKYGYEMDDLPVIPIAPAAIGDGNVDSRSVCLGWFKGWKRARKNVHGATLLEALESLIVEP